MSSKAIHLPFFFSHINLYLIPTPKGYVLVDTGFPGMLPWIAQKLTQYFITPEDLAGVLITHCHLDHMGCAPRLAELGIPILAHHLEAPIMRGEQTFPSYGKGLRGRALQLLEETFLPPHPTVNSIIELGDDERLLGSEWRIQAAPGHSPGSLALWNPNSGTLVTGDTLVTSFGIPQGPHPVYTEDQDQAETSALKLLDLEPKALLPGHGPLLEASAFQSVKVKLERRQGVCPHEKTRRLEILNAASKQIVEEDG